MFISFEKKLEELKRAKEERIEYEKGSKKIREDLTDDKLLEGVLISVLNDVLSYRDKCISILEVLKLGEDYGLAKDEFCIDVTRRWRFSISYASKRDSLNVSICDKANEGESSLIECVCPFKKCDEHKGSIYIKRRLFTEIKDKEIGKVVQDTIIATEDNYKEALRNFVLDFKLNDFNKCFDDNMDKLIGEQRRRDL